MAHKTEKFGTRAAIDVRVTDGGIEYERARDGRWEKYEKESGRMLGRESDPREIERLEIMARNSRRKLRPNTMRYDSMWSIGDTGVGYEFNVKLSTRIRGLNITNEQLEEETRLAVDVFADLLRDDYPWVGDVHLAGRSGGWLAIYDKSGGATEEQLSDINDRVDEARRDFETALIEAFGFAKNASGEWSHGDPPNDALRWAQGKRGSGNYGPPWRTGLGSLLDSGQQSLSGKGSWTGEFGGTSIWLGDTSGSRVGQYEASLTFKGRVGVDLRARTFASLKKKIFAAFDEHGHVPNAADPQLRKAYEFFRAHAGGIVGESAKGALALARAEKLAESLGWRVDWEEDQEEYQLGFGETEPPPEVLNATLKDEAGGWLWNLGGIGMSGKARQDRDYARVIEAELALEALAQKGLL